ncbi:MAG: sigma-70 family RNA polymerase sigma factor, partial [Planctomycetota bacterium]
MEDPTFQERLLSDASWLSRVARSLVSDPATADDLAQETWLLATRRAARGKKTGRGWLYQTLTGRRANYLRDASNRRWREAEAAVPEAVTSPQDLLERAELQQRVAKALTELPEPLRTTALLRFLDQLRTAEIARATGVEPDTVRSRIRRAVSMLREQLETKDRRALAALLPAAKSAVGSTSLLSNAIGIIAPHKLAVVTALLVLMGLTIRPWNPKGAKSPDRTVANAVSSETQSLSGTSPLGPASAETKAAAPARRDRRESLGAGSSREGAGELVVSVRTPAGTAMDNHYVLLKLKDVLNADHDVIYRRTDEAGQAIFSAAEVSRVQAHDEDRQLRVELAQWQETPEVVEDLPLENPTAEPVELTSDLVRLVIRALHPDGSVYSDRLGATVDPVSDHYSSCASVGSVVLWVPRGQPYSVKVYGCGLYRDAELEFSAAGPLELQRKHDLPLSIQVPGMTGRVLMPDGAPVAAGERLDVASRTNDRGGSFSARVDANGRFVYPFEDDVQPG